MLLTAAAVEEEKGEGYLSKCWMRPLDYSIVFQCLLERLQIVLQSLIRISTVGRSGAVYLDTHCITVMTTSTGRVIA